MDIPVLLEPLPEGGFRARSGEPLHLGALGDTPDAALTHLRALIDNRIATGALLTAIRIPNAQLGHHPARMFIETSHSSIAGLCPLSQRTSSGRLSP